MQAFCRQVCFYLTDICELQKTLFFLSWVGNSEIEYALAIVIDPLEPRGVPEIHLEYIQPLYKATPVTR